MSYDPSVYNPNSDPDNVMWEETECTDCGASVTVSVDDTDEPLCYACSKVDWNAPRSRQAERVARALRRLRAESSGDGASGLCAESPTPYAAPRFSLGRLCATPAALERLSLAAVHPVQLAFRHQRGDWGSVCDDDARANDTALASGGRLLSVYPVDGGPVWVLTEADRSLTTVLLPEDY